MNPELQAQLLEILKSLKDGASPVFDELLRQRQLHTLMCIITSLFVSFSSAFLFKKYFPQINSKDDNTQILFIFIIVMLTVICIASSITALVHIPNYFAPLGNVLGQVLK